jgi:acyl carrier protein
MQPDASGAGRLVAFVVAAQGAAPGPQDLRNQLAMRLPDYMIPDLVIVLDHFPLSPNGKVDRGALTIPREVRAEPSASDDVARQIEQIWSDALGAPCLDHEMSFFDLGGNSMLMIAIAAKVQDKFGIEVDLQEFFAAPTIACLARQALAFERGGAEQKAAVD